MLAEDAQKREVVDEAVNKDDLVAADVLVLAPARLQIEVHYQLTEIKQYRQNDVNIRARDCTLGSERLPALLDHVRA